MATLGAAPAHRLEEWIQQLDSYKTPQKERESWILSWREENGKHNDTWYNAYKEAGTVEWYQIINEDTGYPCKWSYASSITDFEFFDIIAQTYFKMSPNIAQNQQGSMLSAGLGNGSVGWACCHWFEVVWFDSCNFLKINCWVQLVPHSSMS